MGDSSSVFPVAMGVIVFVVMLTMVLTISSFQQTIVTSPGNIIEKDVEDPATLLGTQFVSWAPASGYKINATNISDNYFNSGVVQYGANNKEVQFIDPAYADHFLDVRIIRNNDAFGYPNMEFGGVDYAEYLDFITFDGYVLTWGMFFNSWWSAVPYETINASHYAGTNYSVFDIGSFNLSGLLMTNGNATTFAADLWANNYTIHIVQNPQMNYNDFWQVLWWIISFNNAWMPTAPWIAIVVSFIVDIALALMLLFIAQGFIP